MTIVSRGYEGQIMPNVEWAEWQQAAGHEYVASHYDAGRVTIVTSGTRTVRVNVGPTVDGLRTGIGGHGVFDAITAAQDITITDSLPGTGQSKWYLIAARRTWQTTQATTLVAITGTSTQAIPAARQKTPGTVDDQPLALVQITNGSTLPTAVIDLRPVSRQHGDYVVKEAAARDLVMSYMNKVGYRLRIGTSEFVRALDSSGIEVWRQVDGAANAYSWRRGATDTFGPAGPGGVPGYWPIGTLSLPAGSAPGTYRVTFSPVLYGASGQASCHIRGWTSSGANLTGGDYHAVDLANLMRTTVTIPTLYNHPGGAVDIVLSAQAFMANVGVTLDTRITAEIVGTA